MVLLTMFIVILTNIYSKITIVNLKIMIVELYGNGNFLLVFAIVELTNYNVKWLFLVIIFNSNICQKW